MYVFQIQNLCYCTKFNDYFSLYNQISSISAFKTVFSVQNKHFNLCVHVVDLQWLFVVETGVK